MYAVTFHIGGVDIESEWDDTPTARALIEALPLEATGSYWGDEFYFPTQISASCDSTAREVVEPGAVAFWVEGSCLCLFWGPTPVSRAGECRAASKVNVLGRVSDPTLLRQLRGRKVTVTQSR